jgi:hypothetical protein
MVGEAKLRPSLEVRAMRIDSEDLKGQTMKPAAASGSVTFHSLNSSTLITISSGSVGYFYGRAMPTASHAFACRNIISFEGSGMVQQVQTNVLEINRCGVGYWVN